MVDHSLKRKLKSYRMRIDVSVKSKRNRSAVNRKLNKEKWHGLWMKCKEKRIMKRFRSVKSKKIVLIKT